MKNLSPSLINPIDFHNQVIANKRDAGLRARLTTLNVIIQQEYLLFRQRYDLNNLESLVSRPYSIDEKNDLLSLYNFKNSLLQQILTEVTTTGTNRIINTCQNCTVGEVSSFDHFVPKDDFSSFVVNPLNLFPSCSKCNSHKGVYWLSGGRRKFLNLYLDILPNTQYLFATVNYSGGIFTVSFQVDNRNHIDNNLFAIIDSHYIGLKLCARFTLNIDKVISPLISRIKPSRALLSRAVIITTALESSSLNRQLYGYNYWQSIAEIALLNNSDFVDYIYSLP